MKKYGVDSVAKVNIFKEKKRKEKKKQNNLDKYGVENTLEIKEVRDKIRQTNINNKRWIDILDHSTFKNYSIVVRRHTKKLRKELIENWNGLDYYDNEYIQDNFKLNSNDRQYPVIDHKISMFEGFLLNLPYDYVGGFENICITKRSINAFKSNKLYNDFIKSFTN